MKKTTNQDNQDLLNKFFNETKFFHIEFPKRIGLREYIGLRDFKLFVEVALAQVEYTSLEGRVPWLEELSNYPLTIGIRSLAELNLIELAVSDREKILESFTRLALNTIEMISEIISPHHKDFESVIDPEHLLQSEIDWDIYVRYLVLNRYGFNHRLGLDIGRLHRSNVNLQCLTNELLGKYSISELETALAIEGNLISSRAILVNIAGLQGLWRDVCILVSDYTRKTLGLQNTAHFMRASEEVRPRFKFSDLTIDPEVLRDIVALCDQQDQNGEAPLTFLFQGPSGVGKTSLAHAIAHHLGRSLLRITLSSMNEDMLALKFKYFCEMAKTKKYILLFDEADGLFRSSMSSENPAGWARIIFQEFKGLAIFTTNYSLPYGFDRRITYSLKLDDLKPAAKVAVIAKYAILFGFILSDEECLSLAEIDIAPGYYESIFRLASSGSRSGTSYQVVRSAFLQRANFLFSEQELEKLKRVQSPSKRLYFPSDLEKKLQPLSLGVLKFSREPNLFPKGLKAIFSGPPGVGKTAFANAIAEDHKLELKVITPSDILGMYVGQSEKNIRSLFRFGVGSERRILFLDEVESLLMNRSMATRSWELGMSNELLTRLDAYPGIVIAATNRYDLLDPAFRRRFLFHIEFSGPSLEVRKRIWEEKAPKLSSSEVDTVAEFELTGADIEDLCFKAFSFFEMPFDQLIRECLDVIASRRPSEKSISLI